MNDMNKQALKAPNLKPVAGFLKKILSPVASGAKKGVYDFSRSVARKTPKIALIGGGGYLAYKSPAVRRAAKDLLSGAGEKIGESARAIKDKATEEFNKPSKTPMASTEGSWKDTLNMLSGITGGTSYVPQWWLDRYPGHEQGAALAFKAGAGALLAAGLIGGYRLLRHEDELIDIEDADRPGKDLVDQISTTFQGNLLPNRKKQKKVATEVPADNTFSWFTLGQTAIPVGAVVLSAALAYKGVDAAMDAHRNYKLDKAISNKENLVKQLITTRARIAKGTATEDEVTGVIQPLVDAGLYMKSASKKVAGLGLDPAVQGVGLIGSAIVLASAIGAYSYASASDENNLKYKAYKKALREYAKAKAGMTPITVAPADGSSYFKYIDEASDTAKTTPRHQPQLDTDAFNKPISVSF